MTRLVRDWFTYVALGVVWPGIAGLAVFGLGPDPARSFTLLIYATVMVWIHQLGLTLTVFMLIWGACMLVVPRVGFSPGYMARLFFWTSLIMNPLTWIYSLT